MTTEMLEEVERVVQPVDNPGWYGALAQLPGYTGERPALPRGGAVSATHQWGQRFKGTQARTKAPAQPRLGLVRPVIPRGRMPAGKLFRLSAGEAADTQPRRVS